MKGDTKPSRLISTNHQPIFSPIPLYIIGLLTSLSVLHAIRLLLFISNRNTECLVLDKQALLVSYFMPTWHLLHCKIRTLRHHARLYAPSPDAAVVLPFALSSALSVAPSLNPPSIIPSLLPLLCLLLSLSLQLATTPKLPRNATLATRS